VYSAINRLYLVQQLPPPQMASEEHGRHLSFLLSSSLPPLHCPEEGGTVSGLLIDCSAINRLYLPRGGGHWARVREGVGEALPIQRRPDELMLVY
jgi:hypothetical protein